MIYAITIREEKNQGMLPFWVNGKKLCDKKT